MKKFFRIFYKLLIASPGELSGEIALEIKEYAEPLYMDLTITSFNGCYVGYVTPTKYDSIREYETRLMNFFGPPTGDYFTAILKQIVDALQKRYSNGKAVLNE